MSDNKKDVGKEVLNTKVEPKGSIEPTVAEQMGLLMSAVAKLTEEVAELKKPVLAGVAPRLDETVPGFDKNKGYIRRSRGYPVQPGQTWHDLTAAQRMEWFQKHENHWKEKYSQNASKFGAGGSMGWTRG